MGTLATALHALGYTEKADQIAFIQLYHASGALTEGVIPSTIYSGEQAAEFLTLERSEEPEQLVEWLNQLGQAQRGRFKQEGTERQQMQTPEALKTHAEIVRTNLEKLGFTAERTPSDPNVEALLILGAAESRVATRYDAAAKMIKAGTIKPKRILLVTGARDLWAPDEAGQTKGEPITLALLEGKIQIEWVKGKIAEGFKGVDPSDGKAVQQAREAIVKSVKKELIVWSYDEHINWPTEADMMEHLAKQHPVLSQYDITVVNAPRIKKTSPDGGVIYERPNTTSTLQQTRTDHGETLRGKAVAVMSSQPHARYQQGVVATQLAGLDCNIQMAAPALKSNTPEVDGLEALFTSVWSWQALAKQQLKTPNKQVSHASTARGIGEEERVVE